MKAIILAAGMGNRLGGITKTKPKALVQILDKEMLSYTINMADYINISEIVIVGGSGFKQISNYLISNYPNITLIENADYKKGNLYSLQNCLPFIDDDFFIFNVDHFFSKHLLNKIVSFCDGEKNIKVFCDKSNQILKDQMKVICNNDYMQKMSKQLINYDTGYIGLAFCPKSMLEALKRAVKQQINEKGSAAITEDIFNYLSNKNERSIFIADVSNHHWFEIDTTNDISYANFLLRKYPDYWV